MINGKKVLAVIPARGGSKRLPGKNIKDFHGKPLINWTVEAALSCHYIDRVVVNSDSEEILKTAALPGVTLDKRQDSLATDTATSVDVALDVLTRFSDFDVLLWLQPTSPLRTTAHIKQALEFYVSNNATSVISVCPVSHSPLWMNTLDKRGRLSNFYKPEVVNKRSQDHADYYQLNGAIYIKNISDILQSKRFLDRDSYAYVMSQQCSVDIDSALDFKIAECMYQGT